MMAWSNFISSFKIAPPQNFKEILCQIFPSVRVDVEFYLILLYVHAETLQIKLVIVTNNGIIELCPIIVFVAIQLCKSEITARINQYWLHILIKHHVREGIIAMQELKVTTAIILNTLLQGIFIEINISAILIIYTNILLV